CRLVRRPCPFMSSRSVRAMDTFGRRAIGPTETTDIIGYRGHGCWLLSGCYGRRDIGAGKTTPMFGIRVIGDRKSLSMAGFSTASATLGPVMKADTGIAGPSTITEQ